MKWVKKNKETQYPYTTYQGSMYRVIATKYARHSNNRTRARMGEPRSGRTGTQMDIKSLNENEYKKQARLIREGE
jgi:hypothetical protein